MFYSTHLRPYLGEVINAQFDFYIDFDKMNKVYASYFPNDKLPSRTCIGVTGLAVGALVEIDFIAGCWARLKNILNQIIPKRGV